MKVAIIGTVGVPANYGGFETLVEQLIEYNHSEDLQYAVYCSRKSYTDERWVYHGAKIEYVGLNANGIQSIFYDIISLIRAGRKSDVVLILMEFRLLLFFLYIDCFPRNVLLLILMVLSIEGINGISGYVSF